MLKQLILTGLLTITTACAAAGEPRGYSGEPTVEYPGLTDAIKPGETEEPTEPEFVTSEQPDDGTAGASGDLPEDEEPEGSAGAGGTVGASEDDYPVFDATKHTTFVPSTFRAMMWMMPSNIPLSQVMKSGELLVLRMRLVAPTELPFGADAETAILSTQNILCTYNDIRREVLCRTFDHEKFTSTIYKAGLAPGESVMLTLVFDGNVARAPGHVPDAGWFPTASWPETFLFGDQYQNFSLPMQYRAAPLNLSNISVERVTQDADVKLVPVWWSAPMFDTYEFEITGVE